MVAKEQQLLPFARVAWLLTSVSWLAISLSRGWTVATVLFSLGLLLHLGAVVRAFRAGARLPRDTHVGRY